MSTETAEAPAKTFDDATKQLGDQLVGLTLLQAKALADYLKDVHGIEPAGGGAVMMAAPAAAEEGGASAAAVQTEFTVILTSAGDSKINVIKAVRSITGLGLKEAKEVVDNAPKPLKENVSQEEADKVKAEIEGAGGSVEIK
ncbi:MAG: 50S ribosomal protein L7/L12 [Planctomycetaceae bacterium]|nr:50S ribosomal protein L7/L12 [Planctomycetaceae bacterium]